MITSAMEWIRKHAAPNTMERNDNLYTDKDLMLLQDPRPDSLVGSLQGLVDFAKADIDGKRANMTFAAHIKGPTRVDLVTNVNKQAKREHLYSAQFQGLKTFMFGHGVDHEDFLIALATLFKPGMNDDRDGLLNSLNKMVIEDSVTNEDDGFSQTITVKNGVNHFIKKEIENPVLLTPYRTFLEVEQPTSGFLLRIERVGKQPYFKLFETDGGMWVFEAIANIKAWLEENLPDGVKVFA